MILATSALLVAQSSSPVPGFVQVDGVYQPNDPVRRAPSGAAGLNIAFPAMPGVAANPITPEKVELGRLLFFDPILSGDNSLSCATCHHPDFGWGDGRARSIGIGGSGLGPARTGAGEVGRSAPSLWNTGFHHTQFWDGRAATLEEQAAFPIQAPDEMDQDPSELAWELMDVPEYVDRFQQAFGGTPEEAVTFDNVLRAVATFERTLVSYDSRYDRYVQGDEAALTEDEKRGLKLFRSNETNCFRCHRVPTFTDNQFRVIGVPDERRDPGRAKLPGQGPEGAFKVPTLRNIALSAPYMHNGAFATLEEVIDFYAAGGGHARGMTDLDIDPFIEGFEITSDEKSDLVAFLNSLTDTTLSPAPPDRVPSGLPLQ